MIEQTTFLAGKNNVLFQPKGLKMIDHCVRAACQWTVVVNGRSAARLLRINATRPINNQRQSLPRGTLDNNFDFKRLGEAPSLGPRRPPSGAIEYSCQHEIKETKRLHHKQFSGDEKNVSTFGRNKYVGKQGTEDSVGRRAGSSRYCKHHLQAAPRGGGVK